MKTKLEIFAVGAGLLLAAPSLLLAQGFQPVRNSTDMSGLNTNNGFYNDLGGLLNRVSGNVISTSGQNNIANGGYHSLDGANMTTGTNSFFNITHGFDNQAMGSLQWIGGQNNVATGTGTFLFGKRMTDKGLPGNVIFTDTDPHGNRTGGAFRSPKRHSRSSLNWISERVVSSVSPTRGSSGSMAAPTPPAT